MKLNYPRESPATPVMTMLSHSVTRVWQALYQSPMIVLGNLYCLDCYFGLICPHRHISSFILIYMLQSSQYLYAPVQVPTNCNNWSEVAFCLCSDVLLYLPQIFFCICSWKKFPTSLTKKQAAETQHRLWRIDLSYYTSSLQTSWSRYLGVERQSES